MSEVNGLNLNKKIKEEMTDTGPHGQRYLMN